MLVTRHSLSIDLTATPNRVTSMSMRGGTTGVARALTGAELAREVARQRLSNARTERSASSLGDAALLAQTAGLRISEMQRMAGCSRQTLYNVLRNDDDSGVRAPAPSPSQLALEVLVALASANGAVPAAELSKRLRVEGPVLLAALRGLSAQRLCELAPTSPLNEATTAWPTAEAEVVLREHFDDLFLSRPDSIGVYLHIAPEEVEAIGMAAEAMLSRHEHVLMQANVAPSVMAGPELALAVHAPTIRRALRIAVEVWAELRQTADLKPHPPLVATVIPPAIQPAVASDVLDAFVEALIETAPVAHQQVELARQRYAGGIDERQLAARCITAAASALRTSLEQEGDPRPVEDSETAFFELQAVSPLRLDAAREPIQRALRVALDVATERLGPFPGGRMASFRGPDGKPHVVETVQPTTEDLITIAREAGDAVGHAQLGGFVDAGLQVQRVVAGR